MPKKPSSWGIQEYVPQGNGDASGEYADDQGNNRHFENFSNPKSNGKVEVKDNGAVDEPIENPPVEQPPIEKPIDEPKVDGGDEPKEPIKSRFDELSQKQKFAFAGFVISHCEGNELYEEMSYMIDRLKSPYSRDRFGDLSKFSDEDLENMINYVVSQNKGRGDITYNYKDGKTWLKTKNPTALELAGKEFYTNEELTEVERKEAQKIVEKSQNAQDKQIQSILGNNTIVCFGKGYSKDDLDQIVKDTETMTNDFPELKGYIEVMGDVTNTEKLVNALNKSAQPSEEKIQKEIEHLKKYYPTSLDESTYRQRAIEKLSNTDVKFIRLRNAYAYWDDSHKAMMFMPKMRDFNDTQKEYEYRVNFHSSDKRNATYCHEIGHAVDHALANLRKKIMDEKGYGFQSEISGDGWELDRKIRELYSQNVNKDYNEKFDELYTQTYHEPVPSSHWMDYSKRDAIKKQLSNQGIKKYKVSEYGNTKISEFIAECFSAHYTGMNNPLATQVVNTMLEYAKKLRSYL